MKLLVKEDPELGYAYFCPACKRFLCGSADYCIFCGQPLDWEAEKVTYNGKVKWPTTEELEVAYHRKLEGGVVRGTEKNDAGAGDGAGGEEFGPGRGGG